MRNLICVINQSTSTSSRLDASHSYCMCFKFGGVGQIGYFCLSDNVVKDFSIDWSYEH